MSSALVDLLLTIGGVIASALIIWGALKTKVEYHEERIGKLETWHWETARDYSTTTEAREEQAKAIERVRIEMDRKLEDCRADLQRQVTNLGMRFQSHVDWHRDHKEKS